MDTRGANSRRQPKTGLMRSWEVTAVVPRPDGHFDVHYLIGGKETHVAMISNQIGIDNAITNTGVMLAQLPPRERVKNAS